jgi:hypothetical protein
MTQRQGELMPDGVPYVVSKLEEIPIDIRAEREARLRASEQWDERSAVEKLLDVILSARLSYYRPAAEPSLRRDILCLCCGLPYRPDNAMDAENMFLCLSCIGERLGR